MGGFFGARRAAIGESHLSPVAVPPVGGADDERGNPGWRRQHNRLHRRRYMPRSTPPPPAPAPRVGLQKLGKAPRPEEKSEKLDAEEKLDAMPAMPRAPLRAAERGRGHKVPTTRRPSRVAAALELMTSLVEINVAVFHSQFDDHERERDGARGGVLRRLRTRRCATRSVMR